MQQVSLDELVEETVDAMRPQAEAKGVSVRADVPGASAPARANPEKVQRVLFNLIQNAIRHTPADGSVTVLAEAAAAASRSRWPTPATGSRAEDRVRVFEPFYRGGSRGGAHARGRRARARDLARDRRGARRADLARRLAERHPRALLAAAELRPAFDLARSVLPMGGAAVTTIELYGRLLEHAGGGEHDAHVRTAAGLRAPLPLRRWLAPAASADLLVVERAAAPVLDVGCGPGRMLAALEAQGRAATGIDVSPVAVRLARRRGGHAHPRERVLAAGARPRPGRASSCSTATSGSAATRSGCSRAPPSCCAPGGEAIVEVDPAGDGLDRGRHAARGRAARWGRGSTGPASTPTRSRWSRGGAGLRIAGRFEGDGRELRAPAQGRGMKRRRPARSGPASGAARCAGRG